MKKYVFKPFRTYGGCYIYDRSLNTFFRISKEEFLTFQSLEKGKLKSSDDLTISKYLLAGYLTENCVKCIEHPDKSYLQYYVDRYVQYMTLQVTQNCNLRCEYCIYSGTYENQRTHSPKRMSWETAKKALQFYLAHSIDSKKIMIGFYGGEPLLEFELIRKCVSFVENEVQGKEIEFHITTNGTLLTKEKFSFMSEHGFHILISLDGNKDEHDKHRRFASNGEGSFDTIMQNIKMLQEKYPEEIKKVQFNAVMTPEMDLACVMDFFDVDEVISDHYIMFSDVATGFKSDTDEEDRFWTVRNYEYLKYYLALIGKISMDHVSLMAQKTLANVLEIRSRMMKHSQMTECMHHNGPCIPGVRRLFVTVDGDLFPCQNTSEIQDYFRIGSLKEGFLLDKIEHMLNIGALTKDECRDCWKLRLCSICAQQIEFKGVVPQKADKQKQCTLQERIITQYLHIIAVLNEFGYDAMN
ncbi:MAG: Cys-rich peptide radical SAM maturase CcpM [Clostridia bacterium]|nr:Cys-rich peptide radical SAM maturase CcpM [Clostridia bacterium]